MAVRVFFSFSLTAIILSVSSCCLVLLELLQILFCLHAINSGANDYFISAFGTEVSKFRPETQKTIAKFSHNIEQYCIKSNSFLIIFGLVGSHISPPPSASVRFPSVGRSFASFIF